MHKEFYEFYQVSITNTSQKLNLIENIKFIYLTPLGTYAVFRRYRWMDATKSISYQKVKIYLLNKLHQSNKVVIFTKMIFLSLVT